MHSLQGERVASVLYVTTTHLSRRLILGAARARPASSPSLSHSPPPRLSRPFSLCSYIRPPPGPAHQRAVVIASPDPPGPVAPGQGRPLARVVSSPRPDYTGGWRVDNEAPLHAVPRCIPGEGRRKSVAACPTSILPRRRRERPSPLGTEGRVAERSAETVLFFCFLLCFARQPGLNYQKAHRLC